MATLPAPVQDGIQNALDGILDDGRITDVTPVSGGCINHGARIDTASGQAFFLKWNASAPPGMFEAEAEGLTALEAPGALLVPKPVARGGGASVPTWFVMEYIAPGRPGLEYEERLARGLATIHRTGSAEASSFGWEGDNWIGSLPQSNDPTASWSEFFRDRRIVPQLERARRGGYLKGPKGELLERLVAAIPAALDDVDAEVGTPGGPPHLLHGDLWGGNFYAGADGDPVIIDPAVYRGHAEVDLAMTELFGGFGAGFYATYDDVAGISDAYRTYRRALYQLYYLLVHVNLFGASYEARTVEAARTVVSAVM